MTKFGDFNFVINNQTCGTCERPVLAAHHLEWMGVGFLPAFWSGRGGLFGSQVLNIRDGGNFEKRARESRSVDEIPE